MRASLRRPSKKRVILIVSIVLGVLLISAGVYAWLSVQAWNTASETTATASNNLKKSVDDTLATENVPESTQVALYEIVKDYNETLVKGPCELPSLYEWQSNLPWLKETRQKCLDTAKNSDKLATTLTDLQSFFTEETATALLVRQAAESTSSATDYTIAADTWQKLADNKSLTADTVFKPVAAKTAEISKGIADAYSALATANKEENKAAFDTAKNNLTSAYARLAEIQSVSTETQTALVDAVVKAYDNV